MLGYILVKNFRPLAKFKKCTVEEIYPMRCRPGFHRFSACLLCLCAAASQISAQPADAGTLDHLMPFIQEHYPELKRAGVMETSPVGNQHLAVLFRCVQVPPDSLSDSERRARWEAYRQVEMFLALLDCDSLEPVLALGKFPLGDVGFPYTRLLEFSDEQRVVYAQPPGDYGLTSDYWYVYFNLDQKQVLKTRRVPRTGIDLLLRTPKKLVAVDAQLTAMV